jgi:hypothetical protein
MKATVVLLGWCAAAHGFDTGHHADLTRAVLADYSFSDDAVEAAQLTNWLTDYFANFPRKDDPAARLHCDSLFKTSHVVAYWNTFLTNVESAAKQAEDRNDPVMMLAILGASLHVVQDFYSHSTWVELRGGDHLAAKKFAALTFAAEGDYTLDVLTGFYKDTSDRLPAQPDQGAMPRVHGDYFQEPPANDWVNRDSHVRPRWSEAYVLAFCACHEFMQWLKPKLGAPFWEQVRDYELSDANRGKMQDDLSAARGLSMWVKTLGVTDGHWKGNRSGHFPYFLLRGITWTLTPDSIFFEQFDDKNRVQDLLAANLYPPRSVMAHPKLDELHDHPYQPAHRAIVVQITQFEAADDNAIDAVGNPDFYVLARVGGQEYRDRVVRAEKKFNKPWWIIHFVPNSVTQARIVLTLKDEDSRDGEGDDLCDINPAPNQKIVDLTYDLATGAISGLSAVQQQNVEFRVSGAAPDPDPAAVSLLIYQAPLGSVGPVTGPAPAPALGDSVGSGGANQAADVKLVQQLLNQVPHASGGPDARLGEDGIFGPKTAAAIRRFERIQLGLESGRIQSGESNWTRLTEFQNFAQPREGKKIAWGAMVTGPVKKRVLQVADDLEVKPDFLLAAIAFETGESFSPAIKNAAGSGAVGLIQFTGPTAVGLGTTTEALAKMTAVEQLDFVKKHMLPYKGKMSSVDDLYMSILLPAAVGKPDGHVLFQQSSSSIAYTQNQGLDTNKDGQITKAEASLKVRQKLERGIRQGREG